MSSIICVIVSFSATIRFQVTFGEYRSCSDSVLTPIFRKEDASFLSSPSQEETWNSPFAVACWLCYCSKKNLSTDHLPVDTTIHSSSLFLMFYVILKGLLFYLFHKMFVFVKLYFLNIDLLIVATVPQARSYSRHRMLGKHPIEGVRRC